MYIFLRMWRKSEQPVNYTICKHLLLPIPYLSQVVMLSTN